MVASRKARSANEKVRKVGGEGFKLEGFSFGWMLVVTPVGLFLSEVNGVGEFFQARCGLLDPVSPTGFSGRCGSAYVSSRARLFVAACLMFGRLVAFCWLLIA
jgi:hypothetical protein